MRATILSLYLSLVILAGATCLFPKSTVAAPVITSTAQLQTRPLVENLEFCQINLTGTVTMVDSSRELLVLQDTAGAIALHLPELRQKPDVGHQITVQGNNCAIFLPFRPDFPFRPAGREICRSFEAPTNWGEYNLTRMRGYLHPQTSGEYRFWIASDNSSELWLSTDASPVGMRRIASVPHFAWTEARQWSKYPAQISEPIPLRAGEAYYIEAIQEQTAGGENLAVAWRGPGIPEISVIDRSYLTPWSQPPEERVLGILREYWTNFFAGDVEGLVRDRSYEAALTIKSARIVEHGPGQIPLPEPLVWDQPLGTEKNFRWAVETGFVKFVAPEGDTAWLEVFDGPHQILVRALHWSEANDRQLRQLTNPAVRVVGVCEGVKNLQGAIMPRCLWATASNSLTFYEAAPASDPAPISKKITPADFVNPAMPGYYGTRGIVTYNGSVFGENYIFVQQNEAVMRIATQHAAMQDRFKVGQLVDLGGALEPGQRFPTLRPIFVTELGWNVMPTPAPLKLAGTEVNPLQGRWCEIEGVVQKINTNGTLSVATPTGLVQLWQGTTPTLELQRFVDAKLLARGVLLLNRTNASLLLVPSRGFLSVCEPAPEDPFSVALRPIAAVGTTTSEAGSRHRLRVTGQITYQDAESFFLQDSSGGICILTAEEVTYQVGDTVEVVAFPAEGGSMWALCEPLLRRAQPNESVAPREINWNESDPGKRNGSLTHVIATLLAQRTDETAQVLELQAQQRVFIATLRSDHGRLPELRPGSKLRLTGVCDDAASRASINPGRPMNSSVLTSLNLLLRFPSDVTVLSGPAWWTWKKSAAGGSVLLLILATALLWVHLLRRRLQRQEAEQLAFSLQVLGRLEEDRRRIAGNLHDSLGNALMVIRNHAIFAAQSPGGEGEIKNRLREITNTSAQAIEDVRRITHGLRPYQLDRLGLTRAIRASLKAAATHGHISFASRVDDIDGQFDKDAEIHVYRIVQEALTNVVNHSHATEAAVVIIRRTSTVSISIRDNGKGFEPAKLAARPAAPGLGLTGIGERTRILQGSFTIDSKPGIGTTLTVEVPVLKP